MNKCQNDALSKHGKQLNLKKTVQDIKIQFNEEIKILKKIQNKINFKKISWSNKKFVGKLPQQTRAHGRGILRYKDKVEKLNYSKKMVTLQNE